MDNIISNDLSSLIFQEDAEITCIEMVQQHPMAHTGHSPNEHSLRKSYLKDLSIKAVLQKITFYISAMRNKENIPQ